MGTLGLIFRRPKTELLRTIRSGSQVATALSSVIPEQHEGQNMYISECLCGLRGDSIVVESLRVALFLVSNGFPIGKLDEVSNRWSDDSSDDWPEIRHLNRSSQKHETGHLKEDQISEEDKLIMAVFPMSGFNNPQILRQLLSVPGATVQAIAQKLFASAVRTYDLKALRMILNAGMRPDTPVLYDYFPCPPLIIATLAQDPSLALDMVRLLLSHNAGAKNPDVLMGALFHAIRLNNEELVRILLSRGAPIGGEELVAAIEVESPSLVQTLLDADPNVNKRMDRCTILGVAVKRNDILLTERLLALGAVVDALQSITSQEIDGDCYFDTTALGVAAKNKNSEMINLLQARANVNHEAATDRYIPPLVLAVVSGCKTTTKRLLEAGADISVADATRGKTLIERALDRHDLEMCRMLMASGGSVDGKLMEDYYTSQLYQKVKQRDIDTVTLLLSWGARVDENYDEVPDTVLGAAISRGDCTMIHTLLQAGVTNPGQILIEIGSLETAKFLDLLGMLFDILFRCGQPILVSAIREESCGRGDGLVQYLLNLDVDRQRGTVGCQPFETKAKSYTQLDMVTRSSLAEAIFWRNATLAKILVERGAPVTDLELCEAVERYRCYRNYDFLFLLLPVLSQYPCAVPNAFEKAMQYKHIVFLVQHFLDIGLDPRGKVVANGSSQYIHLYQLYGTIKYELLDSVLEGAAVWMDGLSLKTLLRATTWTAIEKGRALTMCIYYKNKHLVQSLLDARADVNQELTENQNTVTPVLLAVRERDIALTMCLINAGADHRRPTIFETAVLTGSIPIVKILLDAGANVNYPASPRRGRTALQLATEKGNIELVDILLEAGAGVNQEPAEEGGATALQLAAIQGYIGIARKLLDSGVDVNAAKSPYWGRTALEGAAEHGRLDMLQLLLHKGASIQGPGRRQYIRAIKLGERYTHYAATKLLRDHGGWNETDSRQYEHEDFDFHEHRNERKEKIRMT